jgi:hypothetical protein
MSSWTLNSPPPARSGLNDAHQWYGVGARGSGEGMLAGLPGDDGTPLLLNLAYRVGLGGSGRGVPGATGGGQQ